MNFVRGHTHGHLIISLAGHLGGKILWIDLGKAIFRLSENGKGSTFLTPQETLKHLRFLEFRMFLYYLKVLKTEMKKLRKLRKQLRALNTPPHKK